MWLRLCPHSAGEMTWDSVPEQLRAEPSAPDFTRAGGGRASLSWTLPAHSRGEDGRDNWVFKDAFKDRLLDC